MNVYRIDEPAVISFSGGRTSAYMLYRILMAHNGTLPDDVIVTFANTGKEMEQTLAFVDACSKNWNVPIVWLELGEYKKSGVYKKGSHKGKQIFKAETKIVNYKTASRNGEPFDILIKKRNYLPNVVNRFCTAELKVRRIIKYAKSIGLNNCIHCIGIRADEVRRATKLKTQNKNYLPLYLDGITKEDVSRFWKNNFFDLELPNDNGTTSLGNCDLCFLKGTKKRLSIIRENPDLADWWIEKEKNVNATFRKDSISYIDMKNISTKNELLDFGNTDDSINCYCGD